MPRSSSATAASTSASSCPEHGTVEDFVCSDVAYYDRHEFSQPARLPRSLRHRARQGLPLRLRPLPRARAAHLHRPGRDHLELQPEMPDVLRRVGPGRHSTSTSPPTRSMVDRYVHLEGVADVLQLSGGEPTLHPDLRPHGPLRLRAADPGGDDQHQRHPPGPRPRPGRGAGRHARPARDLPAVRRPGGAHLPRPCAARTLLETKLAALEALRQHDLRCTLVCTVDHNTNLHEVGAVLRFGLERPVRPRRQLPAGHLLRPAPRPRRPGAARHHARRGQGAGRPDRTACWPRATSTRCRAPIRTAT